jgi:hypothetical protein
MANGRISAADVVARAKARDRQVETIVRELETIIRTKARLILQDLKSDSEDVRTAAREAAQTLGMMYESLKDAGLQAALEKVTSVYGDELREVQRELKSIQPGMVFSDFDVDAATVLVKYDFGRIENVLKRHVEGMQSQVMRSILSGTEIDFEAISTDVSATAAAQVQTELNTGLSAFNQVITNLKAEEAGLDTFEYLGPDDDITRPFCEDIIKRGRIFTKEEILAMDNKQGLPVFETGGGWNCRHQWRPIMPKEGADGGND